MSGVGAAITKVAAHARKDQMVKSIFESYTNYRSNCPWRWVENGKMPSRFEFTLDTVLKVGFERNKVLEAEESKRGGNSQRKRPRTQSGIRSRRAVPTTHPS